MKTINFSYSIKEDKSKNIIIDYGNNEKITLNVEMECLEDIGVLNNFILTEISKNEEIEFIFDEAEESETIKEMILSIIKIYKTEYEDIIENISKIEIKK